MERVRLVEGAILKIVGCESLAGSIPVLSAWRSRQIGKVTILSRWIFCGFDARLRFFLLIEDTYNPDDRASERDRLLIGYW